MCTKLIFRNSCKLLACCLLSAIVQRTTAQTTIATITTIAGTGTAGFSGDGGPATKAELLGPYGITLDNHGNLLIAEHDNQRIRKVAPNGTITTIAGINGGTTNTGIGTIGGYNGDSILATKAQLNVPFDVKVDKHGNIYIADAVNNRIRKIDTAGIITTIAGTGAIGLIGDGGPAIKATLYNPLGLAIDTIGNVFFVDGTNRVRKIDTSGIITRVAGSSFQGGFSGDGGLATNAVLNNPHEILVDNAGNIYIADNLNYRIRKVSTNGIITTVVGKGTPGYSGDGGKAINAELDGPYGVALDKLGNLYITDQANYVIRKVTNDTITTIAGNGKFGYSGDGGNPLNAEIDYPNYLTIDTSGNIYLSNSVFNRVRKITYTKVLPLRLMGFSATHATSGVLLGWQTVTELNADHFVVERSMDGISFTDIGTLKAVGSGANEYSFTDNSPTNVINYYRLKNVDKDGSSTFSKVVSVQFTVNSNQLTLYPNPSKDNVIVKGSHISSLQVIDNSGKVVKVVSLKDATNPTLSVVGLPAGAYHLRVQTIDGKESGVGFVKK